MFGMGFMEIFLILLVAIMALGPEKLPGAMVDMVKFFKKIKSGIDEAKTTLDSEINLSEMKNEANKFTQSISEVKNIANLDGLNDLSFTDDNKVETQTNEKPKEKKIETKTDDKAKAENSKKENISFDKKENA
ncbi:MAG: Sec-independent protein translocase protein TatB [Campylobacterota bacterium]|nr:Sec-independent protein translocase protein TatB [Campylobacterota bacterium]